MYEIFIAEKRYINLEESSVVVFFQLPGHDWSELSQSSQWKAVENFLSQLNEKEASMKNEELITALDEELENCIRKLRNARYGYEIRTFITEYEELMMKKSDVMVKGFLRKEKYNERQKQSKEGYLKAQKESRQALALSVTALIISIVVSVIRIVLLI